ncbi:MAG: sulfite exporter TauE/SafE family protein [Leifsonia sp.]
MALPEPSPAFILGAVIIGIAVFAGAVIQGATGFGSGLIAAPMIGLVDPTLLPATLILVTLPMPLMTGLREIKSMRRSWVGWGLVGRVPGSLAGAFAVGLLSPRLLGLAAGSAVLLAVGASMWKWHPTVTRRSLVTAGALSGFFGTATSIGAPPMALLMQGSAGPELRSTMGAFFFFGTASSLLFLSLQGLVTPRDVLCALGLAVPMLLGFMISGKVRPFIDDGRSRAIILILVAASATSLIVSSIVF